VIFYKLGKINFVYIYKISIMGYLIIIRYFNNKINQLWIKMRSINTIFNIHLLIIILYQDNKHNKIIILHKKINKLLSEDQINLFNLNALMILIHNKSSKLS